MPDGLDAPFWEGLDDDRLLLQRCNACDGWQWGPEWCCHRCHSFDLRYEETPAEGVIYSHERVWHPVHPALAEQGPYVDRARRAAPGRRGPHRRQPARRPAARPSPSARRWSACSSTTPTPTCRTRCCNGWWRSRRTTSHRAGSRTPSVSNGAECLSRAGGRPTVRKRCVGLAGDRMAGSRRGRVRGAVLAAAALVVGGCSSSDDASESTAVPPASTAATASSSATPTTVGAGAATEPPYAAHLRSTLEALVDETLVPSAVVMVLSTTFGDATFTFGSLVRGGQDPPTVWTTTGSGATPSR